MFPLVIESIDVCSPKLETYNIGNSITHMTKIICIFNIHFRFDLKNSNVNDENLDKMAADKTPDVVLVKKIYAEKALRNRKRKWKLKFLNAELHREKGSVTSQGGDFGDFLDGKLNLLGLIVAETSQLKVSFSEKATKNLQNLPIY